MDDVGLAVGEDVEAVRGIALPRDRRAARERELAELAGRGDELLLGEARQDLRQVLVVRVADLHEERDRRGDHDERVVAEVEERPEQEVARRADELLH